MTVKLDNLRVIESAGSIEASTLSLALEKSLRHLPGRREVFLAKWLETKFEIVVKCYYPHIKQERDWHREWAGLQSLAIRGLPAPEPLVVAQAASGEVYLVMRRIEAATTLGSFLAKTEQVWWQDVLSKLAKLVDRLHRLGARQMDQHIDNWAVAEGQVYLLDAATYRFAEAPLNDSDRLEDLAAICVTLPPEAERIFRTALLAEYTHEFNSASHPLRHAKSSLQAKEMKEALAFRIVKIQQSRAHRYYKKTQRACSEFEPRSSPRGTGVCHREADMDLLDTFYSDPDALMAYGERMKFGNTSTVQLFKSGDRRYALKRYNKKPFFTQLRRSLVPSRASRSWSNSWVLQLAFIPTAKPVAFFEERGFPKGRSYLLMELIEGVLLPDYVQQHREDPERMASLLSAVGNIWDLLARLRAAHGDLKATNWMVDEAGKVYLFDLDSFRFGLSNPAYRRGREKDRRRFLKNWNADPALTQAFRKCMEGAGEE